MPEITITSTLRLPSTAPGRFGLFDRMINFTVAGAGPMFVIVPNEGFSREVAEAAIRDHLAQHPELEGHSFST